MQDFILKHHIDCDLVQHQGAIEVAKFGSEVEETKQAIKELEEEEMNYGSCVMLSHEDAIRRTCSDSETVAGALFQPGHVAQFFPAKFVRATAKVRL